jgi:hypothetical protein
MTIPGKCMRLLSSFCFVYSAQIRTHSQQIRPNYKCKKTLLGIKKKGRGVVFCTIQYILLVAQ